MRLLTKAEACRELRLSLSTPKRRIAAWEVPVRREPRGRRHRVYLMLDDASPVNGEAADSELAAARKRVRGLEGQVDLLRGQLEMERQLNGELAGELKAAQEQRSPWWRFWQCKKDSVVDGTALPASVNDSPAPSLKDYGSRVS